MLASGAGTGPAGSRGVGRREFLWSTGIASASLLFSGASALLQADRGWRVFELTTTVEVLKPVGRTRVWVPTPLILDTPYQRARGNTFRAEAGTASFLRHDPAAGVGVVRAEWAEGVKPVLTLTSRAATRDYASGATATTAGRQTLELCLRPTALLPTDGIVRETAQAITRAARSDLDKARAIYEWVVENTFRDSAVKGCGLGDIRSMLEMKTLGGKCADLNALYVGLARAVGLPARDVYGIRVAPSTRGFQSLGPATPNVTKAQHCRAEVFVATHGWIPVDPADVRKVALEEPPGNLPLDDNRVRAARTALFGSWEMNWVAFNFAHDVMLPGATRGRIGYFMYPQCETAEGRLDSLDPDTFRYEITVRELPA